MPVAGWVFIAVCSLAVAFKLGVVYGLHMATPKEPM